MQWLLELCLEPRGYWVAIILLAILLSLAVVAIVGIVQWRIVRQSEQQAALTQDMLQRGMSAEDIYRILSSSRGGLRGLIDAAGMHLKRRPVPGTDGLVGNDPR
jgi:type II secretory pathway pseudopilin PulG